MLKAKEYSIISKVQPALCQDIFEENDFRQDVRIKILSEAKKVIDKFSVKLKAIWLIGSIITYQYDKESDIDVSISIADKCTSEELIELNRQLDKQFNGNVHIGNFPLNFHFINKPFNRNFSEAIYNLLNNHWIKKPQKLSEQDVMKIIQTCLPHPVLEQLVREYLSLRKLILEYSEDKKNNSEIISKLETFAKLYAGLKEKRRELNVKGAKYPVSRECIAVVLKIANSYGFDKIYKTIKERAKINHLH
jgi:predicted nucleotidyltransferase